MSRKKRGVVLKGDNDVILCLKNGKVKWKVSLEGGKKNYIMTKENDVLYFNNKNLFKVDYKSGKIQWQYDLTKEKGEIRSAAVGDKYIFANTKHGRENYLLTLEKSKGKKLWDKKIPNGLRNSPLEYVDKIVCILKGGEVYTFYKDGRKKWNKKFKDEIVSSLIRGNKLYISFKSDKIFGLLISSGKIVWNYKMAQMDKDQLFMIYYAQ